jgi:hypothetical protein
MKSKKDIYTIKKYENEIDLYFNIRKLFIELLNPKNNKEYKLYESYSHMFINIVFLKCRYEEKSEKFIKIFLDKYKKNITIYIKNKINL